MEEGLSSPPKPRRTVQTIPMFHAGGGDIPKLLTLFTPAPVMSATVESNPTPQNHSVHRPSALNIDDGFKSHFTPILLSTDYIAREPVPMELGSESLEGKMVDKVLENVLSLPNVLTEVTSKHRDQNNEIQRQRKILFHLEKQLESEKEKMNALTNEKASLKRQIYLAEEDIATRKCSVGSLEKELNKLIEDNQSIERDTKDVQLSAADEMKVYEEYKKKMEDFNEEVLKMEPLQIEMKQLEEEIERLRAQRAMLEDGPINQQEKALEEQLKTASEQYELIKVDTMEYECKIEAEKEKRNGIKQEIEVLKKRNNAQMTRLKSQLREAQVRKRFFSDQAQKLEQSLAELQ